MMCQSGTSSVMAKSAKKQDERPAGEIDAAVGECIERAMKLRDLNHYSLAEASGISRSYLTRIINGKRRANMGNIDVLSKALKVVPAALLPGGENLQVPGSTKMSDPRATVSPDGSWGIIVSNSEADHVALIVNGLEKEDRERILHYARAVEAEGKGGADVEQGPGRARRNK